MLRRQNPVLDPMSFLAGSSEMATRIREYDWNQHPFGPADLWPQSLRSALGICLQSAFPTAIYWGRDLRLLYNDAWAPIPGPRHPDALGKPAREVWADIWHIIEPQFSQLIETGEGIFVQDQMLPMKRFGYTEETYWNYSFTPIRGEDGGIAGVFNSGSETTRNVLVQREMNFLLDLGEMFRASENSTLARTNAAGMLGEYMGARRVGFRELTPDGELRIAEQWTSPGAVFADTTIALDALGRQIRAHLMAGHVLKCDDVQNDPVFEQARDLFAALGTRAVVAVPWTVNGKVVSLIFVHMTQPRIWTDIDISTVEKVLERTCLWIERERASERERIIMREIDHRARNALAVVQSVVRMTQADTLEEYLQKIEDRVAALARTHSLLSTGHWAPIEFRKMLDQEIAPYLDDNSAEVETNGPSVLLEAEQAQAVALLLHELVTNSAKYGALSIRDGKLVVSWDLIDEVLVRIDWRERNPEKSERPPESRGGGFGSTLLNRIIEQQFGGTISREFDNGSLRCIIELPLNSAEAPPQQARETEKSEPPVMPGRKNVMIVEDEAIVAIDLEAIVEDLGYDVFATTSTVTDALSSLEEAMPDLAIVDLNLSGKSSAPIAEALMARNVPIILATGYTENPDFPDSLSELPRLTKPVSATQLAEMISRALGD